MYTTEAIILRRKPWREADRLIIVLTPGSGKLELIARGASKIRSKLASQLEPYAEVQLQVVRGRTADTVAGSSLVKRFQGLKLSLAKKAWADFTVELTERVMPQRQADLITYRLVRATWELLEELPLKTKTDFRKGMVVLAGFTLKLLSRIGLRPEFSHCAICHRQPGEQRIFFKFSLGGIVCGRCSRESRVSANNQLISSRAVRIFRFLLHQPYYRIKRLALTPEDLQEIMDVIVKFVAYHLEFRPKSLTFIRYLENKLNSAAT